MNPFYFHHPRGYRRRNIEALLEEVANVIYYSQDDHDSYDDDWGPSFTEDDDTDGEASEPPSSDRESYGEDGLPSSPARRRAHEDLMDTSSVESSRDHFCAGSPYHRPSDTWGSFSIASANHYQEYARLLTVPSLKAVLRKWGMLSGRAGMKKADLVATVMEAVMAKYHAKNYPALNAMVADMNEEFFLRNQSRPMAYTPDPQDTAELLLASMKYDFTYNLPHPWILEEKLSAPVITSFAKFFASGEPRPIKAAFRVPADPGARYLLVAIKLYRDEETNELLNYGAGQSEPPRYRFAHIRRFRCIVSGRFWQPAYHYTTPSKIHEVTRHLDGGGENFLYFNSFGPYAHEDYYLQLVKARRDPVLWMKNFEQFSVRSVGEVMSGLRRFFCNDRGGISTDKIVVSLKCPLSLLRMTVPMRSRACRHAQCFDMSSWSLSVASLTPAEISSSGQSPFKCPVCNTNCTPDSLYIDGLALEMLKGTAEDEATINFEEGSWNPASHDRSSHERKRKATAIEETNGDFKRPSRSLKTLHYTSDEAGVIDLTLTPDSPVDPSEDANMLFFKPDPGADTIVPPLQPPKSSLCLPSDPVMLEDADVVTIQTLRYSLSPHSNHRQARGTSLSDAIILD